MRSRTERVMLAAAFACSGWKLLQRVREASLDGQVVLITGGSRGLGLLLAREFGRLGCRIAICARDAGQLERARADLMARGVPTLAQRCDVSDRVQVYEFVASVLDHYGSLDIVVNNAGIIQVGPIDTLDIDDFEHAMNVMFRGALHTTLAVLPYMKARGRGRIVNITSIGGKVAVPHLLPYGCAKFAHVALSEGLAAEVAKDGIRVTTIVPGLMRTGSAVNALFHGRQEREFAWFGLASGTPLTAMSAERAARRIVAATRRGETEVTLTWQANMVRALHGVAPGATVRLLSLVNRLLPDAPAVDQGEAAGMEPGKGLMRSPVSGLMKRAARDTNQFGGSRRRAPGHARSGRFVGTTE
jgi:NAD(P)-dependent dehydrogenase (short-subunit alcohol dehydrogenase family)